MAPIDINLLREEKGINAYSPITGGNPEMVRASQRARFQDDKIVDECIALDNDWRKSISHISLTRPKSASTLISSTKT